MISFLQGKTLRFIKFFVKCEWKIVKMKEIKYTILYCVCEITVPVPLKPVIKLR